MELRLLNPRKEKMQGNYCHAIAIINERNRVTWVMVKKRRNTSTWWWRREVEDVIDSSSNNEADESKNNEQPDQPS
jgi:hypothetical protein